MTQPEDDDAAGSAQDHAGRILHERAVHADARSATGAVYAAAPVTLTLDQARAFAAGRAGVAAERHKPAFWWARDREPWKRVSADIGRHGADLALLELTDEAVLAAMALVDMAMNCARGFRGGDWE
jgi:hypothetical protein